MFPSLIFFFCSECICVPVYCFICLFLFSWTCVCVCACARLPLELLCFCLYHIDHKVCSIGLQQMAKGNLHLDPTLTVTHTHTHTPAAQPHTIMLPSLIHRNLDYHTTAHTHPHICLQKLSQQKSFHLPVVFFFYSEQTADTSFYGS